MLAMPFEGSPRAAELIAALQDFLQGELAELAQKHGISHDNSASKELLRQIWKRSRELGFYGMTLPRAMGGEELSVLDQVLIKEAIYASGSPFAPHVLGELSGPPRIGSLVRKATPFQMEQFIVPVARAEKSICFALTESQAGSDAGAVQTRAVREGEHYVLTGHKRFISGSPFADFAVLMASTAPEGSAEYSSERRARARGAADWRARPRPGPCAGAHYRQPAAALPRHAGSGTVRAARCARLCAEP